MSSNVKVQVGVDSPTAQATTEQQANPTQSSMTVGVFQPPVAARMTTAAPSADQAATPLATAQDHITGSTVAPSKITGDTLLTLGGVQGRADDFVTAGLLVVTDGGRYVEANSPAGIAASNRTQTQGTQPEQEAPLTPEQKQEARLDAMVQEYAQSAAALIPDSAMQLAAAQIAEGKELDIDNISRVAGLPRAAIEEVTGGLQAAYETHAQTLAENAGVDYADFQQWAAQRPAEARNALMSVILAGGDFGPYKAMLQKYSREVPPDAESLQASGLQTRQTQYGKEIITEALYTDGTAPARWWPLSTLAAAGLI